jgi:outer membrane lipoprotein LolB
MSLRRGVSLPAVLPALLVVLLGVSACASLAPRPAVPRAAPFDLLGRVAVNHDGRSLTANVRWAHAADSDDLWLMTPTGQALAHVHEDTSGAVITTADQAQHRAAHVESLTQRALGWALPITHLQYWVRGVPVPEVAADIGERDASGRISQLTQDGWHITYEYYPPAQNDGLPRRLALVGANQTLRLVIDTWRKDAP